MLATEVLCFSGNAYKGLLRVTYLIYLFLIWSTVAEFVISATSPVLSFVDETVVAVFLLHLMLAQPPRKTFHFPIQRWIGAVVLVCAVSWIFNPGSLLNAIQFLFSIIKPIILFLWIIRFGDSFRIARFIIRLLIFLIILQIPFFLGGFTTKGFDYVGDFAIGAGITGDAHHVGTYFWLGIILLLSYFFMTKKKVYLIGSFVCLFGLIVTDTKQITLLLPLVLFVLLRHQFKITIIRFAFVLLAGIGIGYFLFVKIETYYSERYWDLDFEQNTFYDIVAGSEKMEGYYSAIVEVPKELPVPILGAGPGQYASSTAMASRTPLARKFITDYSDLIPEGLEGTLTYRSSGLIALFGDIGIFGLIIFLWMYYKVIMETLNYGAVIDDVFRKSIAFIATASGILIIWESVFQNIFEGNWFILNFFWILSGCVVAMADDARLANEASE